MTQYLVLSTQIGKDGSLGKDISYEITQTPPIFTNVSNITLTASSTGTSSTGASSTGTGSTGGKPRTTRKLRKKSHQSYRRTKVIR